ncbi:MAG TPA: ABC transporter substrate-binding protein/permease, partial [Syntrophomonas sp.]|nr:ABC transporter substrate-binding protein/permease [Syntrophomonas sp.]
LLFGVVLMLTLMTGCRADEAPDSGDTLRDMNTSTPASAATLPTLAELNGKTFAVITGTIFDEYTHKYFPKSDVVYYKSTTDVVTAVANQKVTACLLDEPVARIIARNHNNLAVIDEMVEKDNYGYAAAKNDFSYQLTQQMSEFIRKLRSDGTLDQLQELWMGTDENAKTVGDWENLPAANGTIRFVTVAQTEPFSYYKGTDIVGYDIDMLVRFCKTYGYGLQITDTADDTWLAGLTGGKYDLAAASISITEERKQSIYFSDPNYNGGVVAVVARSEDTSAANTSNTSVPEYASAQELDKAKAKMGVRTGSIQDAYTKDYLPHASISYFEDIADMIAALNSRKIDGFMTTTPRVPFILKDNTHLTAFELKGPHDDTAFMVARTKFGGDLLPQLNEYIASCRQSGLFDEIYNGWFHAGKGNEYPTIIDPGDLPNINGVIRYAAQGNTEPISFMIGSELTGFEMDILTRFCKENGYALEITESNIAGMLAGITTGKYDVAGGALAITEERRQSVDFTDSHYSYGQWIIVRSSGVSGAAAMSKESFWGTQWEKLSNSFYKNFIKESRWKLIVSGIEITLIISIMSALFGTIFGFGVCMLRMRRNKAAVGTAKAFIRIIQGIPMVVLLMVLYYVVFGSIDINAVVVAIVGFTINFGVYVGEIMRTGIEAVDKGQIEAALALGYSKVQTFRRITFPQAARHFLPVYKGEFISMVKMTSIVGYIAIQDLTKVSDIIRSRTYEAFFPLIVSAVIYFLLAWGLTSLLNLIEIRIDPRLRSRKVKGVKEL